MNYNINWEKTIEHINVLLQGKTYKKNFSELFCLGARAVQEKLSGKRKGELSISELMILADYLSCDITDLLVCEEDTYIEPDSEWKDACKKTEVEHVASNEVMEWIELNRNIRSHYEIRNLREFILYFPLMPEKTLKDVIYRCYGNLPYTREGYFMGQLTYLYRQIPESEAKSEADKYRDKVLRVKGAPENNTFGLIDKDYNAHYSAELERYVKNNGY